MKRRPKREVQIFSISALDLFASAMGAFVIIAIILMPYYKNTQDLILKAKDLRGQVAKYQAEKIKILAGTRDRRDELAKIQKKTASLSKAIALAMKAKKNLQAANKAETEKNLLLQAMIKPKKTQVTFRLLGLRTKKSTFVVVLDLGKRLESSKRTMLDAVRRIIEPMKNVHKFGIIGIQRYRPKPTFRFWPSAAKLAQGDNKGRAGAIAFSGRLVNSLRGVSPTYDGLVAALASPAEAIIFITDGKTVPFLNGGMRPDEIIQRVTRENVGRKEIHTVAIGDFFSHPSFARFLQKLATANGGDFMGLGK